MTLLSVNQDLTKQTADALIHLFEIDASAPEIGGELIYLSPQIETNGGAVTWRGQTYQPYPISMDDVEYEGKGMANRPRLSIGNVNGFFSAYNLTYQDMLGAKVTRRRVLSKYLDGHPSANTSGGLPDDVFYIDMKVGENKNVVTYELGSAYDLDGLKLPIPRVNSNFCVVKYRSARCGWVGIPKTDRNGVALPALVDKGAYDDSIDYVYGDYFYKLYGNSTLRFYYVCIALGGATAGWPLTDNTKFAIDVCTKRLVSGCEAHYGADATLPFLAFPGTEQLPSSG